MAKPITIEQIEPADTAPCLCGSGNRFPHCCKARYKHAPNISAVARQNLNPQDLLKVTRAHITWYTLCHKAHTVPLIAFDPDKGASLLAIDINAMSDLLNQLLYAYWKCDILPSFPKAVDGIRHAIASPSWQVEIDYCLCSHAYIYSGDPAAAKRIAERYNWEDLTSVGFLTLWIDLFSDDTNHVEKIRIAEKVCSLTDDPELRLQYSCLIGIQYYLLQDRAKAISIITDAINEYESELEGRDQKVFGMHRLAESYKLLGELSGDEKRVSNALTKFQALAEDTDFTPAGFAAVWSSIADCHLSLDNFENARDAFNQSISHSDTPLARGMLAKTLVKMDQLDEARRILRNIDMGAISNANHSDIAVSMCELAIASKESEDVEIALIAIKDVKTRDPVYLKMVQELTVALYEMRTTGVSKKAESALQKVNKYIQLRPNICGIGIDINAILKDVIGE